MTNVKKAIQEGSQVEAGCDRKNLEKGYYCVNMRMKAAQKYESLKVKNEVT